MFLRNRFLLSCLFALSMVFTTSTLRATDDGGSSVPQPNCVDNCPNPWTTISKIMKVPLYYNPYDSCDTWVTYRYRTNCSGVTEIQITSYDIRGTCSCMDLYLFHLNMNRRVITEHYQSNPGAVPPCPSKITGFIREASSCVRKDSVHVPYAELQARGWVGELIKLGEDPHNYWMNRITPCDLMSCCIKKYEVCRNVNGKIVYTEYTAPVETIPCDPATTSGCEPICDNASPRLGAREYDIQGPAIADSKVLNYHPTPLTQGHEFEISYALKESSKLSLQITSMTGQTVYSLENDYNAGVHFITIETTDFIPGTYLLKISAGISQETLKLVVLPK